MSAEDLGSAPAFRVSDLIRHGAEPPPRRALHALALVSVADRRRVLHRRVHGPGRREHRPARVADLGTRIRLHAGERELGRARLSAGCRVVHADLRPALPDLRQKAVLHRRLRRVHFGQRALRLRAGSPHAGRFRFLQGVGGAMLGANSLALVVEATDKSRRARALGVYAAAQAVGISAGPVVGRPADRDLGLALGVLGQRSLRADLDRRRLAGASGDGAAGSKPNVRLARRSLACACVDARGVRAQSGFRARD